MQLSCLVQQVVQRPYNALTGTSQLFKTDKIGTDTEYLFNRDVRLIES